MNGVWAALWASAGEDEWEAIANRCRRPGGDPSGARVIVFHTGETGRVDQALKRSGLDRLIEVFPVKVSAHPRAALSEQNPEHPAYPDTILAPYASASKRLELLIEAWQGAFGPPESLLVSSTDGLGYFAFHRAWRDPHYLSGTQLALLEGPSRSARAEAAGEPQYRRDHYWASRMETFCRAAAYADAGERAVARRFPLAGPGAAIGGGRCRLTVVIPYYNMGSWIGEAVDSVLQSERPADEILIIDDGSDEPSSLAALQVQAARTGRIRVIRQENRGLGLTRIRGVEEAMGECVFFLDADDAVEPSFFKKAVSLLERFDTITMVTAWEQYFGKTRKVWPKWDADLPWMLGKNMTTPMVMVRRAAWLDAVSSSPEFADNFEDYDAWLSLLEKGGQMVCIPEVLLRHRIRADSRWERRPPGQEERLKAALVRKHGPLYQRHALELTGLLAANGPASHWDTPGAFHDIHSPPSVSRLCTS